MRYERDKRKYVYIILYKQKIIMGEVVKNKHNINGRHNLKFATVSVYNIIIQW